VAHALAQDLLENPASLPPIDKPLPELGYDPNEPAPQKHSERRRLILWGSVAALVLFAFFHLGNENSGGVGELHHREIVVKKEKMTPEDRKALLDGLEEEVNFFIWNDGPLFYEGAREAAKEALQYSEDNARFLGLYAVASARLLFDSNAKDELKSQIKEAINTGRITDPQASLFFRAEALVALADGNNEEAKKLVTAAIEADPREPGNILLAGEVAYAAGDKDGARGFFEEAVQEEPSNVRAHYLLGRVSLEKSDLKKAWFEALEALRWNRLYANGFYLMGEVYSRRNELKEAKLAYNQATRFGQFGNHEAVAKAHIRLGELEDISGNTEEAQKNYRLAYYYWPDASADLKEKVASLDTSTSSLKELWQGWQFEKNFFKEQGDELVRQKKYPEALRFYHAGRLVIPKDGQSLVKIGDVLERVVTSYVQIQKVKLIYERAITRDPANPVGYVKLGLLETNQYNFDKALELLDKAAELAPESAEVQLALGKHFFKRQDYPQSREYFMKAQTLDSTDSESEYYLGLLRQLYNKDEIREPMQRFYRAYTLDPHNYLAMADWLKLKVANYEKTFAVKFLKNLLENEPTNADLYWVFGEVYASNNEPKRAITYFRKALDLDPNNSRFRMSLAKTNAAVRDYEAAVDEYRKAAELDQRSSDGHFEAAKILFDLRKYNLAETELKALIAKSPNYPGAHRYLSRVYQLGKLREIPAATQKDLAVSEMKKEVENNPQNTKFIIELAALYMEYEKYDLAIQELAKVTNLPSETKAPEYKRDRMRAFLLLSGCYRAQSKAENAEGAIKMALSLEPTEPELHRELGYVYYTEQRFGEAAKAFQFYLSRVPAASDAPTIKALIKKTVPED
jgi:tetratricopeptide (TPR) repeat protein